MTWDELREFIGVLHSEPAPPEVQLVVGFIVIVGMVGLMNWKSGRRR